MRTFTALIMLVLLAIELHGSEIESKANDVTIYHSGALVKRSCNHKYAAGLHELKIKNISSKTVLSSLKISNPEVTILNKSLVTKMSAEDMAKLLDRQKALSQQLTLIENKYNEVGFIQNVEDLESMTSFYLQKTLEIKAEQRAIKGQIEEAEKLENTRLDNENGAILHLTISVEKELTDPLNFQYVCGGIGWSPSYDISVNSVSDKNIGLKYLARVMSQTGEDWIDVSVSFSSSFPLENPTELPKSDDPWVLTNKKSSERNNELNIDLEKKNNSNLIYQLEGVQYNEINIIPGLEVRHLEGKYSIKSNSTIFTFPLVSTTLASSFYYYGFPTLDPEVFLVAEITGWNQLGFIDGIAKISFEGNDLGRTNLRFSESEEILTLPIGRDNSIFMQREEIADKKYFKETSVSKKTKTTLAYRFTLKNNNPFPIDFQLVDQVPVSQTKTENVHLITTSDAAVDSENGDVTWNLNLAPNESDIKELIFTIDSSSNYSASSKSRQRSKFRTISCPTF